MFMPNAILALRHKLIGTGNQNQTKRHPSLDQHQQDC